MKTNDGDLNATVDMLRKQLQNAYAQLKERDTAIMLKRLEFLFNVLEHKDCFDSDFIITVADEIKDTLFPKVESDKEE